jgi:predicted transposase YbfD/YdcC
MGPARCWRKRGVRGDDGDGEITVARALLGRLPLAGRVVTADALHCQRDTCRQILDAGGDYLVAVEANQPTLLADIVTLFDDPPPGERFAVAEQRGRHGDRREVRRLWASSALSGYLDWPGAQQVGKVERRVRQQREVTNQTRYFITSLTPAAGAARLLDLKRGHWQIENCLHYVRDVSFGEDASHVRTGAAPQVLAALRNVVLNLLRSAKVTAIKATIRQFGWQRSALTFLGWAPS